MDGQLVKDGQRMNAQKAKEPRTNKGWMVTWSRTDKEGMINWSRMDGQLVNFNKLFLFKIIKVNFILHIDGDPKLQCNMPK